jgi:hypothetical protein
MIRHSPSFTLVNYEIMPSNRCDILPVYLPQSLIAYLMASVWTPHTVFTTTYRTKNIYIYIYIYRCNDNTHQQTEHNIEEQGKQSLNVKSKLNYFKQGSNLFNKTLRHSRLAHNEVLFHSWGWVGPVPDPPFLRKSGSAGIESGTSGSVVRNSDH